MDNLNSTLNASLDYMSYMIDVVTAYLELPVICWAAFALYHQVKADYVFPVYVINLLISDVMQIIGRLLYSQRGDVVADIGFLVFLFGLVASVLFMMCIALERYLVVVHPLWYRCRRTIKHSVLISLVVCVFEVLLLVAEYYSWSFFSPDNTGIGIAFFIILPLPLLVFFLGATRKALSHSISVPRKEKKRILGTLALILLIYLVVFFPNILLLISVTSPSFLENEYNFEKIDFVTSVFLYISPLMDALLYIFIKKDNSCTVVPHCCRRLCACRESREMSTVPTENVTSV